MHLPLLTLTALITTSLAAPAPLDLPREYTLATIFSLPSYAGSTYISSGSYGTCHDLPGPVSKNVQSIKLAPAIGSCTLYGVKGCGTDKGVLVIDRDIEAELKNPVESLSCVPL